MVVRAVCTIGTGATTHDEVSTGSLASDAWAIWDIHKRRVDVDESFGGVAAMTVEVAKGRGATIGGSATLVLVTRGSRRWIIHFLMLVFFLGLFLVFLALDVWRKGFGRARELTQGIGIDTDGPFGKGRLDNQLEVRDGGGIDIFIGKDFRDNTMFE